MKREIHRGYVIRARRGLIDASNKSFPAKFCTGVNASGKLSRAGGDNRVIQVELCLGGYRAAVVYRPIDLSRRDSL